MWFVFEIRPHLPPPSPLPHTCFPDHVLHLTRQTNEFEQFSLVFLLLISRLLFSSAGLEIIFS